ncbi:MAG: AAA family ATPase [Microscillaceae bacterium]|nr:AAA family ATPase [Microscillaceae bacterium]
MLAAKSEVLFEGNNAIVYYQESSEWGVPIAIKVIKEEQASPAQLAAFYNEYEITQHLSQKGIRRVLAKTKYEGKPALVLEFIAGQTLKEYLLEKKRDLPELLSLAIQICTVLGEIHQAHVIHKDIDSKNILLNDQGEPIIIDFGISSRYTHRSKNQSNPEKLEGTLAYIAPEQTGRMNRVVDFRSDLYSFGVLLYEMFAGRLPFQSDDAMELVHSHLAQSPQAPHLFNPELPLPISEIILKLMRKNAEDRYQSAFGLKYDLARCAQEWSEKGSIQAFELGQRDFSGKFEIPQKLYGRQPEIGQLLDAFERTLQGYTELFLVAGYSGVGKSALVHEIYRPITDRRGYFVEGKFDQFQRNIPYFAFIQAFKSFVNRLLTESATELERWKQKILKTVGNNGKVLTDVIPALELIIGKQPEVLELGANEAQNRFKLVFQNFLNVISRREHPLVIFIDDWQWADAASLNLLKNLLTERTGGYLLLIGAYRQNEVSETHPFMLTVEEIREEEVKIGEITLSNLSPEHVRDMIRESLRADEDDIQNLSELIYQKTQGNAFFVRQMLLSLYEDGLLLFDQEQARWHWDIARIRALNITDNVVNFMADKVRKLPGYTLDLLKLASCVGNRFNLQILAIVDETGAPEDIGHTHEVLEPALMEGLIVPLEDDYKFAHDRIQQAVYSLIPDDERQRIHLNIGRLLLTHIPIAQRENFLFDIVNQWNFGRELLQDPTERRFLAGLNLEAGRKAKDSAAYKPASAYLKVAAELLPPEAWESDYNFTLLIYAELIQVSFLKGDWQRTKEYIQLFLEKAHNTLDKMPAFEIEMQYHIARSDLQSALETGLQVLEMLNIPLAEAPHPDIEVDKILGLPFNENEEVQAAMEIMDSIISPAWTVHPEMFRKITYTMVNLSIRYGNSASSCVGYAFYGGLLCGEAQDIGRGYQFGKLAVTLLDKMNAPFFRSKVENIYVSTVMHWKEPARATRKPYFEAIQIGLETGEIEFASYNIVESCHYSFLMGISLESLRQKYVQNLALIEQLKQTFHRHYLTPWQQMIEILLQDNGDPLTLQGQYFDEEEEIPRFISQQHLTLVFVAYQAKTMLSYLFGDYVGAVRNARLAEHYRDGVMGMLFLPVHNFYYSLALLAHFPDASPEEKGIYLQQVAQNQKQLKNWSQHAPANYQHKYLLVQAELLRLSGQMTKAMDLYEEALALAHEHLYIQEEAVISERAAIFYTEVGKERIAKTYWQEAYYRYQLWGANRKLRHLEQNQGRYLQKGRTLAPKTVSLASSASHGNQLDMYSIIKASQALSGEVVWSRLLQKMMHIVIENAGAEKGYFIMQRDEQWAIVAESLLNQEISIDAVVPLEEANRRIEKPRLSVELVNYVLRTGKSTVINNAQNDTALVGEEYAQKVQPKSILCMPLIHQGKISGILYLENNLATDAFTPDRLEILEILSTQITISLENALLYENLEEKVRERTEEVVRAKEIIEKNHQDITSSINYAKRIQDATLPRLEEVKAPFARIIYLFSPPRHRQWRFLLGGQSGQKAQPKPGIGPGRGPAKLCQ